MGRKSAVPPASRLGLSGWRVVTWLLLLLAVFGIFQYSVHAWQVAEWLRKGGQDPSHAALTRMLAWDIAYLLGACITLTVAAAALLRRGWAWFALRVVAGLLALWLLVTALVLAAHWSGFSHRTEELMSLPKLADSARVLVERARRNYLVGMGLKLAAVPVLAWLSWHLGRAPVRGQFGR